MKKLNLVLIFLLAASTIVFAQKKPKIEKAKRLLDNNEIAEAKSIIDAGIEYDKTKDDAKTWYYRGLIYEAIYNSEDPQVKNLSDHPYEIAVESYKKVKSMEKENSTYYIFADQRLVGMYSKIFNVAADAYQNEDYQKAINYFNLAKMIYDDDTTSYMYAGYAANQINEPKVALENFEYLAKNNMADENVYRNLIYIYKADIKDTTTALNYAKEGVQKFPESKELKQDEITLLIMAGKANDAEQRLKTAIEKDPDNAILYYELGYIYDAAGDIDESIEWYKKCLEKNPELFDALFNLGVAYYNQGADILKIAQEMDLDTYKKKGKEVEDSARVILQKALPYFEKAREINPKDIPTLQTLQTLYSLMKNYDKVNEVQEQLDSLGAGEENKGGK